MSLEARVSQVVARVGVKQIAVFKKHAKKYREQKKFGCSKNIRVQKRSGAKKIALAQAKKIKSKKFESKKNATHVAKKNLQLALHWQYAGCVACLQFAICIAGVQVILRTPQIHTSTPTFLHYSPQYVLLVSTSQSTIYYYQCLSH